MKRTTIENIYTGGSNRIVTKYSENDSSGNHSRQLGEKRPYEHVPFLCSSCWCPRQRQLEVEYKAFQNGNSTGGNGPSLAKTRRSEKKSTKKGERPRIGDLRDKDRAGDLNPMASPNPYDRHNASVESRRSDEARGGRYMPIRSRLF